MNLDDDISPRGPPSQLLSNVGVGFAIFKGNCGCAILYMPRAWMHGGILMATAVIPVVGLLAIFSAVNLLKSRREYGGSYGDLVGLAIGQRWRLCVNASILLYQSGTACSYYIVVAELLQSTLLPNVQVPDLILGMAVAMVPLAAIRKMSQLWPLSAIGSVLVIGGSFMVLGFEAHALTDASREEPLLLVNWKSVLVCIGQGCFMFEGIGLVLPTYDAARNQENFPLIYVVVLLLMLTLVSCVGVFGYIAYGLDVQNLVLLNFPQSSTVTAVKLAFAVQALFSFPLQLLPAVRLVESSLFTPMSNPSLPRKSAKTAFRAAYVALLALVAILAASKLDNFVSLIGALCGVPVAFIFPAICHHRLLGSSPVTDFCLVVMGLVLMVTVTYTNVNEFVTAS